LMLSGLPVQPVNASSVSSAINNKRVISSPLI
jgi:hypothetical protein